MMLNRQRSVRVSLPPLLVFMRRVQRILRVSGGAVTVCLIEDAEMARLNRTYRRKQGPTDVLSFPAESRGQGLVPPSGKNAPRYLGDIAVAPATARRNAKELGRTLSEELRILILHGVLHLLGYDHETDHGEMERYELRLRRRLGLAP